MEVDPTMGNSCAHGAHDATRARGAFKELFDTYRGLIDLIDAIPEGTDLYRPAFAVAEQADADPIHSDLLDTTCDTVTAAFARGREAGKIWIDAHLSVPADAKR